MRQSMDNVNAIDPGPSTYSTETVGRATNFSYPNGVQDHQLLLMKRWAVPPAFATRKVGPDHQLFLPERCAGPPAFPTRTVGRVTNFSYRNGGPGHH